MQERYREAVDQASQILAKALIDDIENVVEQGKLLDKHVQVLVRETGRLTVSRMYAAADHYLTETYKREDWRIEQHPVVEFSTLFGPAPYGEVEVLRHVYQTSAGGKTFCPLERDARIVVTSTPRFAKVVANKFARSGSTQWDFLEPHTSVQILDFYKV